jgi:hypothetical protein
MKSYTMENLTPRVLTGLYVDADCFTIAGLPGHYRVLSLQYVSGASGHGMDRINVELQNSAHDDQVSMSLSRKMST